MAMAGEPGTMCVRVGPLAAALEGASFVLDDERVAFRHFPCAGPPNFTVQISTGTRDESEWRVSSIKAVDVSRDGLTVAMTLDEWDARIDMVGRRAQVELPGPWARAVDSFLKTLVQLVALRDESALLFHASSLVIDGRGYLFVGPSGAGKTTVAEYADARGAEVLSEELSCVSGYGDTEGFAIECLPLRHRGIRSLRPRTAPLVGVFALAQANEDRVSRLGEGDALRAVLRCVTTGVKHPYYSRQALSMSLELLRHVPVWRMDFRKGDAFLDLLRPERLGLSGDPQPHSISGSDTLSDND